MSLPRLWIIVVRGRRNVLKHIRGYLAELNDSEFSDTLTATAPPDPLPLRGTVRAFWQRPVVSAPDPALGGERLCVWAVWESVIPPEAQTLLDAKEAQFPTLLRTFKQAGSVDGQGTFTPSETIAQFKARIMTAVNWQPKAVTL